LKDTVLMEEMSWEEIKESIDDGKTTVLVYAGAIEQHGPHLPTLTDTLLGYEVGQRVARKLGNALVASVIRPGMSEHHIDFPGTLSLSLETFRRVVEETCVSLSRTGFAVIVLVSSHGGNTDTLRAITPDISKKIAANSDLFFLIEDAQAHDKTMRKFQEKSGATLGEIGVHSGMSETSMVLAVRPELVDMKRAQAGLVEESFYLPENVKVSQMDAFINGIKSQVNNGILGDPRRANAELGRELLDAIAEDQAIQIRKIIGILSKKNRAQN
jgi:creatinine amidohydrolase